MEIEFYKQDELLNFFRQHKGKKLNQIYDEIDASIKNKFRKNKGMAGQIFEGLTGRVPNNDPEPDIKNLQIELKALPVQITKDKDKLKKYKSKERSKIKSINYEDLLNETWQNTKVRKKINKVLYNVYLHPEGVHFSELDKLEYIDSFLFELNKSDDKQIIKEDWELLSDLVCSLEAHNLTEKVFNILSASTSGTGKMKTYYPIAEPAKERSYSFKNEFMSDLFNAHTNISYDAYYDKEKDFVSTLENDIKKIFYNKTVPQIVKKYALPFSSRTVGMRVLQILKIHYKVPNNKVIKEFEKHNIIVKTIPVDKITLKVEQNISFPKMSLRDLLYEKWEENNDEYFESQLKNEVEKTFVFLPIYKKKISTSPKIVYEDISKWYFGKPVIWIADDYILANIQKDWEKCRKQILNGKVKTWDVIQKNGKVRQKNNLLKKTESEYIHIRPHTSDKTKIDIPYSKQTNGKINICWQSFWLNHDFVHKIINDKL